MQDYFKSNCKGILSIKNSLFLLHIPIKYSSFSLLCFPIIQFAIISIAIYAMFAFTNTSKHLYSIKCPLFSLLPFTNYKIHLSKSCACALPTITTFKILHSIFAFSNTGKHLYNILYSLFLLFHSHTFFYNTLYYFNNSYHLLVFSNTMKYLCSTKYSSFSFLHLLIMKFAFVKLVLFPSYYSL